MKDRTKKPAAKDNITIMALSLSLLTLAFVLIIFFQLLEVRNDLSESLYIIIDNLENLSEIEQ